ncbi:unnamed protein product [Pylaiella littoralis]
MHLSPLKGVRSAIRPQYLRVSIASGLLSARLFAETGATEYFVIASDVAVVVGIPDCVCHSYDTQHAPLQFQSINQSINQSNHPFAFLAWSLVAIVVCSFLVLSECSVAGVSANPGHRPLQRFRCKTRPFFFHGFVERPRYMRDGTLFSRGLTRCIFHLDHVARRLLWTCMLFFSCVVIVVVVLVDVVLVEHAGVCNGSIAAAVPQDICFRLSSPRCFECLGLMATFSHRISGDNSFRAGLHDHRVPEKLIGEAIVQTCKYWRSGLMGVM